MHTKAKKLAKLLANNWRLHDKKKYLQIEVNSTKLLNELEYPKNIKVSSKLISNLFVMADNAEREKNTKKRLQKYNLLIEVADKIDKLLDRKLNSRYEIKWWIILREKGYFFAAPYIFIDQLKKFGKIHIISAIIATTLLVDSGKAHDHNDWRKVEGLLEVYWNIIIKKKAKKFLEF